MAGESSGSVFDPSLLFGMFMCWLFAMGMHGRRGLGPTPAGSPFGSGGPGTGTIG